MSAPASQQAEVAARRALVLSLLAAGKPYREIAEQTGLTPKMVAQDVARALRDRQANDAQFRDLGAELEAERLDAAERHVQAVIEAASVVVETDDGESSLVLDAVNTLLRLSAARAQAARDRRPAVTRKPGEIEQSMRRKLDVVTDETVRSGPLATTAVMLAAELDAGLPPREAAVIARELRLTVAQIDDLSPARPEGDDVGRLRDEVAARRAARAAAG